MTITVYGSKISTYTLRVLVTLRELDVGDYKWAPVNMAAPVKEHHSHEFKSKLQPFGQVPVMHDDDCDLTLFESRAIARYLAEKFHSQGTALLGTTPREKALVNQWIEVESQNFNKPVGQILLHTVFSKNYGITGSPEVVEENLEKLEKVLDVYEAHLARSKYLAGDFFSLADLHHLPATNLLIDVAKKGHVFESRPHVSSWWKSISSRPAFRDCLAFQKSPGP
ncbi:hypothetical protein M758_3G085500 [Ceratodon purpureus]|nr:hypothetical protein M758_3G085500 [Ceratodon purpureus]